MATPIETFLRQRLKALRKASGLTQPQVAELAGMSYNYYQDIEYGVRPNVSLRMLAGIAWAYGVTVSELFAAEMPKIKLPSRPVPPPHYKKRKK